MADAVSYMYNTQQYMSLTFDFTPSADYDRLIAEIVKPIITPNGHPIMTVIDELSDAPPITNVAEFVNAMHYPRWYAEHYSRNEQEKALILACLDNRGNDIEYMLADYLEEIGNNEEWVVQWIENLRNPEVCSFGVLGHTCPDSVHFEIVPQRLNEQKILPQDSDYNLSSAKYSNGFIKHVTARYTPIGTRPFTDSYSKSLINKFVRTIKHTCTEHPIQTLVLDIKAPEVYNQTLENFTLNGDRFDWHDAIVVNNRPYPHTYRTYDNEYLLKENDNNCIKQIIKIAHAAHSKIEVYFKKHVLLLGYLQLAFDPVMNKVYYEKIINLKDICTSMYAPPENNNSSLNDEFNLSIKLNGHHFTLYWMGPDVFERINNPNHLVYTHGAIWYIQELTYDAFEGIDREVIMNVVLRKVDLSWIRDNADKYLIGPINKDTKFDMEIRMEDCTLYDLIYNSYAYAVNSRQRDFTRRMFYAGSEMTILDTYRYDTGRINRPIIGGTETA